MPAWFPAPTLYGRAIAEHFPVREHFDRSESARLALACYFEFFGFHFFMII